MNHDTDHPSSDEGSLPRRVRGTDGGSITPEEHDQDLERTGANTVERDEEVEAELEEEVERHGTLDAVAAFSGPLPPANILRGYEELVPGSAADIIGAHVKNENARANALTRLTRAESFGVVTGTSVSGLLALGGLVAGVVLIVNGYPGESLFGFIPAALSSVALVVSAVRGNKSD